MFRKKPKTAAARGELPRELLWLLDAPLFIDEKQVEAFYDAVLRPDYERTSLTLNDSVVNSKKGGGRDDGGFRDPVAEGGSQGRR